MDVGNHQIGRWERRQGCLLRGGRPTSKSMAVKRHLQRGPGISTGKLLREWAEEISKGTELDNGKSFSISEIDSQTPHLCQVEKDVQNVLEIGVSVRSQVLIII